ATRTAGLRRTKLPTTREPDLATPIAAPVCSHLPVPLGRVLRTLSPTWPARSIILPENESSLLMGKVRVAGNNVGTVCGLRRRHHVSARPPWPRTWTAHVPRGLARCVAVAFQGSSGQGCFGYRPFISLRTSG